MNARIKDQCVLCKREYPHDRFRTKCECGGLVDPIYDLQKVEIGREGDMVRRYRHLLPIEDESNLVSLGAGNTPTIHAKKLGAYLGLDHLYLKDETRQENGTTKARTASVVLSYFKEMGVFHFTSSATGNSSTGFASATIKTPPFQHSIFLGSRWKTRLTFDAHPRVHVWILEGGTVNEGIAFSRKWERENKLPSEGGFFNMARREGLKLAMLEAYDQTEQSFDWYVQGVSTAMGAYGAFKGAKEYLKLGRINKLPKLLCVQEATCAPQVRAFEDDSPELRKEHVFHNPDGIADALLKGDPTDTYPYMYKVVKESGGAFVSVTADEIRQARSQIFELEGIPACNASSTTIAALNKLAKKQIIGRGERILANITGSDRNPSNYCRTYTRVVRDNTGEWVVDGVVKE